MKKKAIGVLFALFALLAFQNPVFAQVKTSLTVQSDQHGAKVYLNDRLAGFTSPGFSTFVSPGLYFIRLTKEGFPDFRTTVVVGKNPITIVANFGGMPVPPHAPAPWQHQLIVDANVRGAQVFINGAFAGTTPYTGFLNPGTYAVTVRFPGYEDYSRSIRLAGSYRLYASLTPLPYPVYIDVSNVPGAQIYRDSLYIGTTPYHGAWMPGTYYVRIIAPGYDEYVDQVSVSGPLTMQVSLAPALVDYEIKIPDFFLSQAGRILSFADFQVYLDGRKLDSAYGKALSGVHRLTIFLNDVRLEADFVLSSGRPAIIEPFFGIKVQ